MRLFRSKKTALVIAGLTLFGLVFVELVLRYAVGLGDPPLFIFSEKFEYQCKPSSTYRRLGHNYTTNRYGMRSDDFEYIKPEEEFRILVIGDSIPNGGSHIDQRELATELLKKSLENEWSIPVVVANISAGSWCPANQLAYLEEYGTFNADLAIVLLNGDDLKDYLRFDSLNPVTHPTRTPNSATSELLFRYVVPRIKALLTVEQTEVAVTVPTSTPPPRNSAEELGGMLKLLYKSGIKTFVVYHPSKHEWKNQDFAPMDAFQRFQEITEENFAIFFSLDSDYRSHLNSGSNLYLDRYHPNANGHVVMTDSLLNLILPQREMGVEKIHIQKDSATR